jgi:DNA replication protein DnaC
MNKGNESLGSIFANFKPPSPTGTCADCGDGVFHNDTRCRECAAKVERARAARARAVNAASASIPASFAFTRAGLADSKVRACVRDHVALAKVTKAASGSEWLLLRGEAGLGKSVCAAAVAWSGAERGVALLWLDAFELANAVARAPLGVEPRLVRDALAAPLLVVDDLGSETAVPTSPIAEVLHRRHARGARTIVTTWLDIGATEARYGSGIARRLYERAVVVEFHAPKGHQ